MKICIQSECQTISNFVEEGVVSAKAQKAHLLYFLRHSNAQTGKSELTHNKKQKDKTKTNMVNQAPGVI